MTIEDLEAKIDKVRKQLERLNAEKIDRLPEATVKQLNALLGVFRSDTGTPREVGLNVTFKVTKEDSLAAIRKAKSDRVDSLNTKAGQTKVKNSLASNVGITRFHVKSPITKGEKAGKTPVAADWLTD